MKLDPKKHIWLGSKPARRIFNVLPNGSARFVGGCVRNALLGVPVTDFDIATTQRPEVVMDTLKAAGISVHAPGLAHGTVTAMADETVFEITTLRRDVSTDGRRAGVTFTGDWFEDAQRRDFTINALYVDPDGTLQDPTGEGLKDIRTPRIRFVGTAEDRIQEDYLRILRFFRFHTCYAADTPLDRTGLDACRDNKGGLDILSVERVWSEIRELLTALNPLRTVTAMLHAGILEQILPEAGNVDGLSLLCTLEEKQGFAPDPFLRLMAMAARDEMAIASLCKRLKMSNAEKARLMGWAMDRTSLAWDMSVKDINAALYQAGIQVVMDRAVLRAAGTDNKNAHKGWLALAQTGQNWKRPQFPLKGHDLIDAGIDPGEKLGSVLRVLKALWIKSGFTADRKQLLAALKFIDR